MKKITTTISNILNFIEQYYPDASLQSVPLLANFYKETKEDYMGLSVYLDMNLTLIDMVKSKFFDFDGSEDEYNNYCVQYFNDNHDHIIKFAKYEEVTEYNVLNYQDTNNIEYYMDGFTIDHNQPYMNNEKLEKLYLQERDILQDLLFKCETFNSDSLSLYEKVEILGNDIKVFIRYVFKNPENIRNLCNDADIILLEIKLNKELEEKPAAKIVKI